MADGYTATVQSTYGTLPRGYPWVILAWYAIVGAIFATLEVHSWSGVAVPIMIFVPAATMVLFLRFGQPQVFAAQRDGIRLGSGRHRVQIPWGDIQEVRISPAASCQRRARGRRLGSDDPRQRTPLPASY